MPTTQLCVGRVLYVHYPAPDEHCQPGKEQVLHMLVGESGLLETQLKCLNRTQISEEDVKSDVTE